MAITFLYALSSPVQADPLTTYTLTDLGPGTPTLTTGANGGIVIAANGQSAYPFQEPRDTTPTQAQLSSSHFPLLQQAPTYDPLTYGNPANAYSMLTNTLMNSNGIAVAIDASGVLGHYGSTDVYYMKQDAGGWSGSPTYMWSGGSLRDSGISQPPVAAITGINALNQVLGSGLLPSSSNGMTQAFLYHINTNSLLDLSTLGVLQAGGWGSISPIAIDDQGRILLKGNQFPGPDHTLLLTPEGVSSNPLAVPAPEPETLALAVIIIAALALRRTFRSGA